MAERCLNNDALSRLCLLFQLTDLSNVYVSLLQDNYNLLISLSQILNQIRRWINEYNDDQQRLIRNSSCSASNGEEHDCLTHIFTYLIPSLNVKNQFVQHLVSNIFLAISEFLQASGSNWEDFICILCGCFEISLCNALLNHSQPSICGAADSKLISSSLSAILNTCTWHAVNGITKILRGIVKLLKEEDDAELLSVFLNELSSSLSKAPWDLLNGLHNESSVDVEASPGRNTLLMINDDLTEVKFQFLGYLIQLLCSLVGLNDSLEDGTSSLDKSAILQKTCVPIILRCCFTQEQNSRCRQILNYVKHKSLILMLKLSSQMKVDCSALILWLELLREYYQGLLSMPLFELDCDEDNALEGSPFLLSLYDQDASHLSSRHLQRRAVFLFLRCSLGFLGLRNCDDLTCVCTNPNSLFESDLTTRKYCVLEKKGLFELSQWLQGHFPSDMLSHDEMYLEKCIKFAASFIRLYMHEDDMLFEILLQMFSVPSWAERLFIKEGQASRNSAEDILFHISNIFNPVLLFHILLAELQYDYQLLLDYLISKDTGSRCAEYLLRCLRTVCDSWPLFVKFPAREPIICRTSHQKKQKTMTFLEERSAIGSQCGYLLPSEQFEGEQNLSSNAREHRSLQFDDAKACLISLKRSLEKLHRRKLFPYNPEVLICRLSRFEELYYQHA